MYRHLMMFPASVDGAQVERIAVDEIVPAFRASEGFLALSLSVGPLMGPAARGGETSAIVEADFETLDDSLAALKAPGFERTKAKVESLGTRLYLFEVRSP